MMKVKVAFGNDMRLFKYEGASLSEAWDLLTTFVVKTFEVENFRLQYRDDEDDLITVSSPHELDEAFDFAMEQGKTLKVFVVAVAAQQAGIGGAGQEQAAVEEVATGSAVEEKEAAPSAPPAVDEAEAGDEPSAGNRMHALASLILEDEGFRQEIAAFAQDVVLQVREGDSLDTAIETALAAHEELSAHPFVREHLSAMLPAIAAQGAFVVPFLKTIEPTAIPGMIDQAAQSIRDGQHMMPFLASMLGGGAGNGFPFGGCGAGGANGAPPMMGPFGGFGGMPFFGGGFGPHGQRHGPPGAGQGFPFGPGCHGGRGGHGHGRGRGHHGARRGGCGRFNEGGCGKQSKRQYRAEITDPNVTLVDKAMVLPNSSVVKTWRIRNTGEEDFPEGTKLKYVGRPFNQLVDGVEFPVEAIPVAEEGEVSILLSTPGEAGRFGSAWRLILPDGTPFGPMFRARVVVVSGDGAIPEIVSDESDDMADIYDTKEAEPNDKKAKKLQKLMAKKTRLEAQSAKLDSRLDNVRSRIEEMTAVASAPIVSTLPSATAGGDVSGDAEDDNFEAVVVEADEADTFANELAELQNMGFSDSRLNRMLLEQYNGQMDAVLNTLLEMKA